jgi:hypothetical protein
MSAVQELRAETRGDGVAPYERAAVSEAKVTIGSPGGLAAVGGSPTPISELPEGEGAASFGLRRHGVNLPKLAAGLHGSAALSEEG